MGKIGRITYPDSGPIGKLADLFARFATSVDAALPVIFVPSLAALNATGLTTTTLAGTLATLTADDSGLSAGAQFVLHPDGKWRLTGTCKALNVDTFVAAIASLPNVRILAGAQAWNAVTSSMIAFTSTAGAYVTTSLSKQVSGSGTTPAAVGVGGTYQVGVAFPPGTFASEPSNIIVTSSQVRFNCAAIVRTKDGFTLQLANWSNGNADAGAIFYWTAFA